jgi:hypothetical protein
MNNSLIRRRLNLSPLNLNLIPNIPSIIPPVHSGAPNQVISFGRNIVWGDVKTDAPKE